MTITTVQKYPQPAEGFVFRGEEGATHVVEPTSGEIIDLAAAAAGDLAALVYSLRELGALVQEAVNAAGDQLMHRMDRSASWTMREDGWTIKGASPKKGRKVDGKTLAARLDELVELELIDQAAVEQAVKVDPTYKVKLGGVDALLKLGLEPITTAIDECTTETTPARYVDVSPDH